MLYVLQCCPNLCLKFLLQDEDQQYGLHSAPARPLSPQSFGPPSVFSKDIWLGDNLGESLAFARDVKISGWTNVGDKPGGGYVGKCSIEFYNSGSFKLDFRPVYDCVIKTTEVKYSTFLTVALLTS